MDLSRPAPGPPPPGHAASAMANPTRQRRSLPLQSESTIRYDCLQDALLYAEMHRPVLSVLCLVDKIASAETACIQSVMTWIFDICCMQVLPYAAGLSWGEALDANCMWHVSSCSNTLFRLNKQKLHEEHAPAACTSSSYAGVRPGSGTQAEATMPRAAAGLRAEAAAWEPSVGKVSTGDQVQCNTTTCMSASAGSDRSN